MARIAIVTTTQAIRLTLEHRTEGGMGGFEHVTVIPGANRVDADFWEAWLAENENYAPLTSGAIAGQVVEDDEAPDAPEAMHEKVQLDADAPDIGSRGETSYVPAEHGETLPVSTPTTTLDAGKETDPVSGESIQTKDAK